MNKDHVELLQCLSIRNDEKGMLNMFFLFSFSDMSPIVCGIARSLSLSLHHVSTG
jgi:hypothetical protein